ncbi:MAG: type II toxin-antitoxin system RelE/ParE family toxin [Xenococcaceae cyanobacterium MO_234.B1]|nr:type II toxin-antitoxin system RelE/ParE family toxin [Xenococcaceae cyanobacterium MO_234.B1]
MPETQIIFYQEEDGTVPVVEWLKELKKKNPKGFINCLARIQQLQTSGHELRRPASDYLRDGIRELRAKHRNVQYRILYFFQGQNIAILAHAIIKKGSAVPNTDIEKAITRKNIFEQNPTVHTYQGEI